MIILFILFYLFLRKGRGLTAVTSPTITLTSAVALGTEAPKFLTVMVAPRHHTHLLLFVLLLVVLHTPPIAPTVAVIEFVFDMAIMPLLGDITKKQRSLSHLLLMVQHTPSIARNVVLHTPLMGLFMIIFDMAIMPFAFVFIMVLIGLLCDFIIGLNKEEKMAADNNNNNNNQSSYVYFFLFCFPFVLLLFLCEISCL